MSSPTFLAPLSKRVFPRDDQHIDIASQRPKRRCVSPTTRHISSLYAPGGALDFQTPDSQWCPPELPDSNTADIDSKLDEIDTHKRDISDGGRLDGLRGKGSFDNSESVQPLRRHHHHNQDSVTHPSQLCNACGSLDVQTNCRPSESHAAAAGELATRRDCGVQTTPYAGCTLETLLERFNYIECKPRYDADGNEYVPDSEGESNEELRMPDLLRRPRLFRRTVPTAQYPGTWRIYEELRRRHEAGELAGFGGAYPGRCALVDRVELQNMARRLYLQRVLGGLEPEPSDSELRHLMRPYTIISSLAD